MGKQHRENAACILVSSKEMAGIAFVIPVEPSDVLTRNRWDVRSKCELRTWPGYGFVCYPSRVCLGWQGSLSGQREKRLNCLLGDRLQSRTLFRKVSTVLPRQECVEPLVARLGINHESIPAPQGGRNETTI